MRNSIYRDAVEEATRFFWVTLRPGTLFTVTPLPRVTVDIGGVLVQPIEWKASLDPSSYTPEYTMLLTEVDVIALQLAGVDGLVFITSSYESK
jgi:hypothetical protein